MTVGTDGLHLLAAIAATSAPTWLRQIPAVQTLRQVWIQQFYRDEAGCGPLPRSALQHEDGAFSARLRPLCTSPGRNLARHRAGFI